MASPIQVPANVDVITLVSDMASVGAAIQAQLRSQSANDAVISINIVRQDNGNGCVAIITLEHAP